MAEYWVATTGDDFDPGTELEPWEHIQKAATVMVAGDLVHVVAGTYIEEVTLANSGAVGQWITYLAEGVVVVEGNVVQNEGFKMNGKSYIIIDGFIIQGQVNRRIYINNCHHIEVANCTLTDYGLYGLEAELVCTDLEVHHCDVSGGARAIHSGIKFDETSDSEIHHNEVHDNTKNGISLSHSSDDNVVYKNASHDNVNNPLDELYAGIAIEVDSENNVVWNNVIWNNPHAGILTNSPNNEWYYNTIYNSAQSNGGGAACYLNEWGASVPIGNIYKNNIFVPLGDDEKSVRILEVTGRNNTWDHNVHWHPFKAPAWDIISWFGVWPSFAVWQAVWLQDPNGMLADPLFINPGTDFRLQGTSPALDVALNIGIADDYRDAVRPQGAGYDIGAYERLLVGGGAGEFAAYMAMVVRRRRRGSGRRPNRLSRR